MPYGNKKLLVTPFALSVLVVWPPAPTPRGQNQRCLLRCDLEFGSLSAVTSDQFSILVAFSFHGLTLHQPQWAKHVTDKIIILFCESYHMFPSLHNSGHSFLGVILPLLHHPLCATSLLSLAAIHLFPNNALCCPVGFHHIYLYPQQVTAAAAVRNWPNYCNFAREMSLNLKVAPHFGYILLLFIDIGLWFHLWILTPSKWGCCSLRWCGWIYCGNVCVIKSFRNKGSF